VGGNHAFAVTEPIRIFGGKKIRYQLGGEIGDDKKAKFFVSYVKRSINM